MLRASIASAVLVLALVACSPRPGDVIRREGEPDVSVVAAEDAEMDDAIDSARVTVATLIGPLRNPPSSQTYVAVKVPVDAGSTVEHLWIDNLSYDGGRLRGRINNDPTDATWLHLGDSLSIDADSISDWMAVDNGRLVGAFTLRVVRARLSPAERARLDAQLGVTIGN